MRSRILIAGVVAGSLLVSGCANTDPDDVAGALLIGAVVIGLGVLAISDDESDHRHRSHSHSRRHRQHDDYDRHSHRHHRERSRYADDGW